MTEQAPAEQRSRLTRVYGDDDADLGLVQNRNVTLLGYDDRTRAHALCLRDSGVDLRVGVDARSNEGHLAASDGLRVMSAYDACEEADLLVIVGDPERAGSDVELLRESLVAGDAVVLGPDDRLGFQPPAGVDVVRVVAWASAAQLRSEYTRGRGVAMFVSVLADASGTALELALAYARGLGATRTGVIQVDEDELALARAAADRVEADVLTLARREFDALLAGGCGAELAYRACFATLATLAGRVAAGRDDDAQHADRLVGDALAAAAATVRSLTPDGASGGREME